MLVIFSAISVLNIALFGLNRQIFLVTIFLEIFTGRFVMLKAGIFGGHSFLIVPLVSVSIVTVFGVLRIGRIPKKLAGILLILFVALSSVLIEILSGSSWNFWIFDRIKNWYWWIPFFAFFTVFSSDLSLKKIRFFFNGWIVLNIVLAFASFTLSALNDFFTIDSYEVDGLSYSVMTNSWANSSAPTLFYLKPTSFANMCVVYMVYTSFFFPKKFKNVVLCLLLACILITGIRAPFAIGLLYLVIFSFLTGRTYLRSLVVATSIFLSFFWKKLLYISMSLADVNVQGEDFAARIIKVISYDWADLLTKTTLRRSISLLEYMDYERFFVGLHQWSTSGYRGVLSPSDAYLLFLVVEMGVIGVMLSLLPLAYFSLGRSRELTVLFIVMLLQTVVDTGIFYVEAYLFFAVFKYLKNESLSVLPTDK